MYLQNMGSQFQDVQKNIILRAKKQPQDVYVPVQCGKKITSIHSIEVHI